MSLCPWLVAHSLIFNFQFSTFSCPYFSYLCKAKSKARFRRAIICHETDSLKILFAFVVFVCRKRFLFLPLYRFLPRHHFSSFTIRRTLFHREGVIQFVFHCNINIFQSSLRFLTEREKKPLLNIWHLPNSGVPMVFEYI